MATVQVRLNADKLSDKSNKLLAMLSDKSVKTRVNQYIADALTPYVPMKSGKLRDSMYVGPNVISWGRGLDYAHYQYEGVVYGPNIPVTKEGTIVRWFTPPSVTKVPTERELGVPGEWHGWQFGYTTPDTQHHWDRVYERAVKSDTNQKITRYLKRECKARGLNK